MISLTAAGTALTGLVSTIFGAFLASVSKNREVIPRISFAVLIVGDCAVEVRLVSLPPSRRVRDEYQAERLHIVISP
jgi:purine-cytosine permease-like protein